MTHDLVIRGGTVVDGSGGAPFVADVGISDGRIAAVGSGLPPGHDEIDAAGLIVTPGFVDIHTHYDGQVTWENRLSPSSNHGVTTVVMGNCGVGFAPCRPEQRAMLVELMEGVEDIPGIVMTEGLPWNWESFPDYLDALAARRFDIDIVAQLPHSPLRVYVMGARGARGEAATDADLAAMERLTAEAIAAGAIGVSTSRSHDHRSKDGGLAPSIETEQRELLALARGLRSAGRGVFQIIGEPTGDADTNFALVREVAEEAGRPVSFTLLQGSRNPEAWATYIARIEQADADGLDIRGQVFPRPIGLLFGLDLSLHPFMLHPGFQPLIDLPLAEKVRALGDPALRARLLAEQPDASNPQLLMLVGLSDRMYRFGDPPRYEPAAETSLGALAAAQGVSPLALAYDALLEQDGRAILYVPFSNFVDNDSGVVRQLMAHPRTVIALGDGGAHYGMICDASYPTYMLTRWVRDAGADEAFALAWAVKALTRDPVEAIGLTDRGLIRPGLKADLNLIDLAALTLHAPTPVYDLPAGGRRLRQEADGYVASIVSGVVTYRHGRHSGALPGRLVRGAPATGPEGEQR